MTKLLAVTHMGHDGPWLLLKTRAEIDERLQSIDIHKPEIERKARKCLIQTVTSALPSRFREAAAKLREAYAKLQEAYAKWQGAHANLAKLQEAYANLQEAAAKLQEAYANLQEALNSPEGVTFHAKVCGCPWSPSHSDVLEGLAR